MSDSVFVECPNCKELTEYGAQMCPRCREEIDPQYADASAAAVYVNTQACNMANTIKGGDMAAYLSLPISAGAYAIDKYAVGGPAIFYLVFGVPAVVLTVILVWFNRYALFKAGDEEFLRAKRGVRGSLLLWLAILAVQVVAFLTLRG
jgi:hypothetical protein